MKKRITIFLIILFCLLSVFSSSLIFYINSYPEDTKIVDELINQNIFHKMKGFKTISLFGRIMVIPDYVDVIESYVDHESDDTIKFDNLVNKIKEIEYVDEPTENIFDGANCQTMTIYIQDWCEKNNIPYRVIVEPTHVFVIVQIKDIWKIINFNRGLEIHDEYIG